MDALLDLPICNICDNNKSFYGLECWEKLFIVFYFLAKISIYIVTTGKLNISHENIAIKIYIYHTKYSD